MRLQDWLEQTRLRDHYFADIPHSDDKLWKLGEVLLKMSGGEDTNDVGTGS